MSFHILKETFLCSERHLCHFEVNNKFIIDIMPSSQMSLDQMAQRHRLNQKHEIGIMKRANYKIT
jgi:hypothetical protein